ncbi:arylsulfatase A-like enzyme [Solirubrobacter pauli]|uniref:Arylsulfatase A-like enzyme n=1 Tax=Solirubrobacter pauli TaxID=166793 RepID=A0A660KX57_9ACTN|nr:sulfatase [Solirubrobacter pauli]RKQ85042.1 arylsulfatase A-like enzyme [Solirubrobacter pauli]
MSKPNFVYLHSHDTGRHVGPYGSAVATPNIQRLADQGVLYRQAFSAAPVCSPSRAALLTGEFGMRGLAHRGWRLPHPEHHLVRALRAAGYATVMVGEQHVMPDPREIGYDAILDGPVADRAAEWLRSAPPRPFFLSAGFQETHRPFPDVDGEAPPPPHLPDVPVIRRDMAGFHASAAALDAHVGTVLDAVGDDTLVILTTDHGLAFPGAKATLTDRGIGVMLIIRGPGFGTGTVSDELVSQVDLFPTICELAEIERPGWLRGRSLLDPERNEAVFAEMTFHAAYEPQRAIRTRRYKYIRRFDNGHEGPVLVNIDDSPSKDYLLAHGLADRTPAAEELYDLVFDPGEASNLAGDPAHEGTLNELRGRLLEWMAETGDPLLQGPVEPEEGVEINLPSQRSPDEPTIVVERP